MSGVGRASDVECESDVRYIHASLHRVPAGHTPGKNPLPAASFVVPFWGLTNLILRILKGNPPEGTTMETIGRIQSS